MGGSVDLVPSEGREQLLLLLTREVRDKVRIAMSVSRW